MLPKRQSQTRNETETLAWPSQVWNQSRWINYSIYWVLKFLQYNRGSLKDIEREILRTVKDGPRRPN